MGVLSTATVDIVPNLKPLYAGLAEARVSLERFARTSSGISLAGGVAAIGVGLGAAMMSAAKKAAGLAEIMNKVKVTFGLTSSSGIIKQADELADRFGLVKKTTLEAAANFGLFGRAAGMSSEESSEFAKQLVQLGADLSSFHKIGREETFRKLESGLQGYARPLRDLGIFLSEDAVKARALAMGLGQVGKELTDQEKIRARFSLIMEQAGPAKGDLSRTIESTHNQILKAQGDLENLVTTIGHDFEPALLESIKLARDLGKALSEAFAGKGITSAKVGEGLKTTIENWSSLFKLYQVLRKPETAELIKKYGILLGITEAVFQLDNTPGGGKGLPATLPELLAKQRADQDAKALAEGTAATQRAMPPTLKALAETELGPETVGAEKHAEERNRVLHLHMRRIQADRDAALVKSIGVALPFFDPLATAIMQRDRPQGFAALQRNQANKILERMKPEVGLNVLRNLTGGPINALMGGGYGGMALATGFQKVQSHLEKFGESAFDEGQTISERIKGLKEQLRFEEKMAAARKKVGIYDRPSQMFGDPEEFARSAIQGVLSPSNDQVQAIKDSIKVLEAIRDKLPEKDKVERPRGLFPLH